MTFSFSNKYKPAGDQQQAIDKLVKGFQSSKNKQTLFGVTGSGKTFTIANVIKKLNKPTLVIAHNKTLAAQLTEEYKSFFPDDEVHYFVSYYDYYQPEAYIPARDVYIEKDAQINKKIDMMRHSTTQSLLISKNVIVVASVSAIYGLPEPTEYDSNLLKLKINDKLKTEKLIQGLVKILYERKQDDLDNGSFRVVGDKFEIVPISENFIYSVVIENDMVKSIKKLDIKTRAILQDDVRYCFISPAKHFIFNKERFKKILRQIESDLDERVKEFERLGKTTEKERITKRVQNDLILMREVGYCPGIENYSRYFDGRRKGDRPFTLVDYFQAVNNGDKDFLVVIDESHVTLPQLEGMYVGDRARKRNLVQYGFRLEAALDNRPLTFDEFNASVKNVIYASATPAQYELTESDQVISQIIRPTGIVDPLIEIRPISKTDTYKGQVEDVIEEAMKAVKKNGRVLVTITTKRLAELLSDYFKKKIKKTEYIHGDVKTIDRIKILNDYRKGKIEVLIGVNLLREGLDLPEVTLVAVLDADKKGFLRNKTSLIQTIGRVARNVKGRVILYADDKTDAIMETIEETDKKRELQLAFNKEHNITPENVSREITNKFDEEEASKKIYIKQLLELDEDLFEGAKKTLIKERVRQLNNAVKKLDFRTAAILRDEIIGLEKISKKAS